MLGGRHGQFAYLPPPGYAPAHEALLPEKTLVVETVRGQYGVKGTLVWISFTKKIFFSHKRQFVSEISADISFLYEFAKKTNLLQTSFLMIIKEF